MSATWHKTVAADAIRAAEQDISGHTLEEWPIIGDGDDFDRCMDGDGFAIRRRCGRTSDSTDGGRKRGRENMDDRMELDIDALLAESLPKKDPAFNLDIASLRDRQLAREVAISTKMTTLIIMGHLHGPKCMPANCQDMGSNFKLISMRKIGHSQIAMFSVPVEGEMAELFEEIDGRPGLHAVAYDAHGRTKEAYVL